MVYVGIVFDVSTSFVILGITLWCYDSLVCFCFGDWFRWFVVNAYFDFAVSVVAICLLGCEFLVVYGVW